MDELEIKQGSFIQQTQYFIQVEIDLSSVLAHLGIFSLVPSDNRNTRSTCPTSVFTGIGQTLMSRPGFSVHSHFRNRYLSFYWKKWFYIWYMALASWLVPCLPFLGLPHIYFLFTVRLRIFHVCRNENFRNNYLSFYWKKWFYIWYMALAWWLVPCLPFTGLPHIYFLFTMRLTNERVGVFIARRRLQHLVVTVFWDITLYC
jgi:hypothetical protein